MMETARIAEPGDSQQREQNCRTGLTDISRLMSSNRTKRGYRLREFTGFEILALLMADTLFS